jgi:outer membrane protein OmpA-like peptidoglycan-associated protein
MNNMLNRRLILIAGLSLTLAAPYLYAKDCSGAQTFFNQGLEQGKKENWNNAKSLLKQSIKECDKYDNWYLLGQAEFYSGNYVDAADAYIESRKYAENDDQIALSIARYAEAQNKRGFSAEASGLLHDAKSLHSNAPSWIHKLVLDIDSKLAEQPMTSDNLTRALTSLPPKSFHKYQPKYSLRLNFEFDSTNLANPEAFDIGVISQALDSKDLEGKKFILTGHSDIRGEMTYNQQLSQKRAEMIKEAISQANPSLGQKISVSGAGESQPLYQGDDEQVHLLNRRVEIAVTD